MTNPIDLIGEGIKTGNWKKVVQGYQKMTGRKAKVPSTPDVDHVALLMDLKGKIEQHLNIEHPEPVAIRTDEDEAEEAEEEEPAPESEPPPTQPEPADEFAKFRVTHGQPKRDDGKVACKTRPFAPGSMQNSFVDNRTLAAKDIRDSRAFSKKRKPQPRRPPVKYIEIVCDRCGKQESVNPNMVPPRLDKEDERPKYICNSCVAGNRK